MQITIDNILSKQNKTRYWLAKKCNCNYYNLCDICQNKTKSISFDLLEKICIALDVTPNQIIKIEKHT